METTLFKGLFKLICKLTYISHEYKIENNLKEGG